MSGGHDDAPLTRAEQDAAEWLSRLREGGRRYQIEFEDWYSADPGNADAYDRVLATYELAGRRGAGSLVTGSRRNWGIALAAIAAVLALVAYLGAVGTSSNPVSGRAYAAATKVGEIRTVALDDGTKVTLDTQSAIRAEFDPKQRQVHVLHGRAHFEVAAEPRPFVISTDGGSVSTSGSVLDVGYIDGYTQVGLLSGTAALKPSGQKAVLVKMVPGTSRIAARDGSVGSQLPFSSNDVRWTAGMLPFEDVPVATVIASANRYSDTQIVLADLSIGERRFTGTVKASDTLALARMIAAMFNLQLDMSTPNRLILSRK